MVLLANSKKVQKIPDSQNGKGRRPLQTFVPLYTFVADNVVSVDVAKCDVACPKGGLNECGGRRAFFTAFAAGNLGPTYLYFDAAVSSSAVSIRLTILTLD